MPAKPLTREQTEDAFRLREAFEARQLHDPSLTQMKLAHACGWNSQGSVSQYLNGRIPLNLDALIKFADALHVTPKQISPSLARKLRTVQTGTVTYIGGKGAPVAYIGGKGAPGNVDAGPDLRGSVPVISWVQAGAWAGVDDPHVAGDAEEWIPSPVAHGPRTFVLRVRGISMENPHGYPSFREGDLIFVDPDREALHRSLVIAKRESEQEATFKQLLVEGNRRYLKALNPAWPEQIIQLVEGAIIVGVVIFKGEAL